MSEEAACSFHPTLWLEKRVTNRTSSRHRGQVARESTDEERQKRTEITKEGAHRVPSITPQTVVIIEIPAEVVTLQRTQYGNYMTRLTSQKQ